MLAEPDCTPPTSAYEAYLDLILRLTAWCQERHLPFLHEMSRAIKKHIGEPDEPMAYIPRRHYQKGQKGRCRVIEILNVTTGERYRTDTDAARAMGMSLAGMLGRLNAGKPFRGGVILRRLRREEGLRTEDSVLSTPSSSTGVP